MKLSLAVVLGFGLVAAAAVPASAESTSQQVTYGAGSAFGTLLYAPFKTSFCVVGAVTSALTLPFGGTPTAERVATAACGGTWVITPDVLRGRDQVRFVGGGPATPAPPKR